VDAEQPTIESVESNDAQRLAAESDALQYGMLLTVSTQLLSGMLNDNVVQHLISKDNDVLDATLTLVPIRIALVKESIALAKLLITELQNG
jgi:hypothetical protein